MEETTFIKTKKEDAALATVNGNDPEKPIGVEVGQIPAGNSVNEHDVEWVSVLSDATPRPITSF
jgi:desulfoferrodoxin (superoxide reductase-like protein)